MRVLWLILLIFIISCKPSSPKTPEHVEDKSEHEADKTHTAPPPAYGNKVVKINSDDKSIHRVQVKK